MSVLDGIEPAWIAWATENLLRGAEPASVTAVLAEKGLEERANAVVQALMASPILQGAGRLVRRSAAIEQAGRLHRSFERLHTLEVSALDEATFFRDAWTAHRPLVFRQGASHWAPWSLEDLEARFGGAQIEVMRGRSQHQRWWHHREALGTRMPLAELLELMRTTEGDDVYGVGRNDVLDAIPALKAELGSLPGIGSDPHARLWIGPAGTFTPLHHDQSAAWLVQRVGRKRVWIASPLEPALFDTAEGVFNLHDARRPAQGDLAEVHWFEVVIEPGDAVFLPAGWWHQVLAETPSVSVSLGGFRWPNRVTWYAPARYATSPS